MPVAIVVGFGAVIVALFAWQMAASWDSTFGPLFESLASKIDGYKIPLRGLPDIHFHFIASAIRSVAAEIRHLIGLVAHYTAWPLVQLFHAVRHAFWYPARQLRGVAEDTASALYALRHVIVPAMIAAKVAWIPRHIAALAQQVASLVARAPVHIVHDITRVATHYATTVVNKAVAVPWPRIRAAEREVAGLDRRVRSLEKPAALAALAAILTATIARTSFRWLRCSRVRRVGKQVCGMDAGILDALLADTLLIVGTISLVEFAEGLQDGMSAFAPQIRRFWDADKPPK